MQNIRNKLRLLVYHLRHDIFTKDHSFLLIVAAICIVFVISAINAMSRNWELEQRLAAENAELALLRLEVETAELENLYYNSEEYQELSARQHLNKQLPGEHLVYLPANSIAAQTKHDNQDIIVVAEETNNFAEWLEFLFGI